MKFGFTASNKSSDSKQKTDIININSDSEHEEKIKKKVKLNSDIKTSIKSIEKDNISISSS